MGCPRCSELMTQECFSDRLAFALHAEFAGWHCISCWEILDRLALAKGVDGESAGPCVWLPRLQRPGRNVVTPG